MHHQLVGTEGGQPGDEAPFDWLELQAGSAVSIVFEDETGFYGRVLATSPVHSLAIIQVDITFGLSTFDKTFVLVPENLLTLKTLSVWHAGCAGVRFGSDAACATWEQAASPLEV